MVGCRACPNQQSKPRKHFLQVNKCIGEIDYPVTKINLEHGVNSGVTLAPLVNGLVPIYEEHIARLDRGIGLNAWGEMSVEEKAMIIAMRRVTISMQNLQNEAEIKAADRQRKK